MTNFPVGTRVLVRDDDLLAPSPGTVTANRYGGIHIALDPGAIPVYEEDTTFLDDWIMYEHELEYLDD